jgi:hypothetical protein
MTAGMCQGPAVDGGLVEAALQEIIRRAVFRVAAEIQRLGVVSGGQRGGAACDLAAVEIEHLPLGGAIEGVRHVVPGARGQHGRRGPLACQAAPMVTGGGGEL